MFKAQANAIVSGLQCRKGTAMVEYAILMALITSVAVVALTSLGTSISAMFMNFASRV